MTNQTFDLPVCIKPLKTEYAYRLSGICVNAQPSVQSYKNRHHDGDGCYFLMKQFSGISGDHGMSLST